MTIQYKYNQFEYLSNIDTTSVYHLYIFNHMNDIELLSLLFRYLATKHLNFQCIETALLIAQGMEGINTIQGIVDI